MNKFLASLVFYACFTARLLAWNAEGHMVIAQLAYNHLDASVKIKCDSLIAVTLTNASVGTSNFVTAACWADDFKTPLGTGIWHYLDIPFSLDGTSTSGVSVASFDVVRAIQLSITTLQSTNATLIDQATSLRYLIHFVGDIQQPLHCSTAVSASRTGGDAGGNSFSLTNNPSWGNLHSLWDGGGGYLFDSVPRPLSATSQTAINNKVAAVEAAQPFTNNVGVIPNPIAWAVEGFNLAQTVCYVGITPGAASAPSAAYLNTAQATTQQRMAQGGQRLANLLNTIFSTTPFPLTARSLTNSKFVFSWGAISGRTYRVQWKQQLTDAAWNNLADLTTTNATLFFTNIITPPQRFYRVTVVNSS